MTPSELSYTERVFLRLVRTRVLEKTALRALRKATLLLSLALGSRLAQLRETGELLAVVHARTEEQAFLLALAWEAVDILGLRWDKIPDKRRPQYRPDQRFRILRFKDLLVLSREEAARAFRVSPGTIGRWEQEALARPGQEAIGSLVKPVPPVRRYADVVRHMVQIMAMVGFNGCNAIARTLSRAGWKISKDSVRRFRREPRHPPPPPSEPTSTPRAVMARYPNHVWMMDLTEIPGLFRIFSFRLLALLDVFSRMPLAAKLFVGEPTARDAAELLLRAARTHGPPRHFVSDRGGQFTGEEFREALARQGTRQRFGAVGRTGSIAVIERFWRTVKEALGWALRPIILAELQRRLELTLLHYAYLRPHQALGGGAPAEVYFGIPPAHLSAVHPPRGRPRDGPPEPPFEIAFLDRERRLPFLIPKAA